MKIKTLLFLGTILVSLQGSQQLSFIPPHLRESFGDALEAIFGMGVRLQALLSEPNSNENFMVSPLSAALIIGQLMLGAEGDFREHLYELLALPEKDNTHMLNIHNRKGENSSMSLAHSKLHVQLGNVYRQLQRSSSTKKSLFTLESANALFVNHYIHLYREFVHNTELLYNTKIYNMDFNNPLEALGFINRWGSEHTNGLIRNILQVPPGPNTAGIFANAIYFQGEWEQPFSSEINQNGPFFLSAEKTVPVTFMTGLLEGVPYAESKILNCKMVVLPYKNRELGMYVVLPNKGHEYQYDIKKFATTSNIKDVLDMIEHLADRDVVIKLPKMTLTTTMSILRPLQKYAYYRNVTKESPSKPNVLDTLEEKIDAFENFKSNLGANIVLSNAADNAHLTVSDILQQMSFAINEKGTEVAAITASIMDYNGGSKSFLANKPFMFFIRHEATAATLFWGTISNPLA